MADNGPTFDQLMRSAEQFGAEQGKGRDSQVAYYMMLTEASYLGSLDDDKNKHGDGLSDTVLLARQYATAGNKAAKWDAKTPASRALMSKFRKCIEIGAWSINGQGGVLTPMNKVMSIRAELKKDAAKAKTLMDAGNVFMRWAREQLETDLPIGDADLENMCYRKSRQPKSHIDVLKAQAKSLKKIIDGEADVCDDSDEVQEALNKIEERIEQVKLDELNRTAAQGQPTPLQP